MRILTPAILGLLACLAVVPLARAIDITVTYESVGAEPADDPNGDKLKSLAEYVAGVYEDMIEDAHAMEFLIRYEVVTFTNGQFSHLEPDNATNRSTQGRVCINPTPDNDPAKKFYYDPTPEDDSEYDMRQWLFRDLSNLQQTNRFNGATPELFEAGYRGPVAPGAPLEAQNATDLLTILFHEMGHGLGLSGSLNDLFNPRGTDETDDGDFDVNPDFVNGNVMALNVRDTDSADSRAHVFGGSPNNFAIMSFNSQNARRRPSATDLFAMASIAGWTDLDLRRQDFLGGSSFNDAGNWMGNQVPGNLDDASVRHGETVELETANETVRNLLVAEGSIVRTGNRRLTVTDTLIIEAGDQGDTSAAVFVDAGGELIAGNLRLNEGGQLAVLNGTAKTDRLFIDTDASMIGGGTLELTGLFPLLNNNGLVSGLLGQTLTVTSGEPTAIDLDGDGEDGEVDARQGDLVFDSGLTDRFDGEMRIGSHRTISFTSSWSLGIAGLIELDGDLGPATLDTSGFIFGVRGRIDALHQAVINAVATDFKSTANVNVLDDASLTINSAIDTEGHFHVGAGGRLTFGDDTNYQGGVYTGPGTLVQNGDARIQQNTTIGVDTYDWDGNQGGNSETTVDPGVTLTINAERIEDSLVFDGHDGKITLNGGALSVNTTGAWGLDGILELNEQNGFQPSVGGQQIIVSGSIVALGSARIFSDLSFQPSAVVNINGATKVLTLEGDLTYGGGGYFGFGTIRQNGDAMVVANTQISVSQYDLDGQFGAATTTIGDDVEFTLDVGHIDVDATDEFGGTLNVAGRLEVNNLPNQWTNKGIINLDDGVIAGAKVVNMGTVNGNGIFENDLHNTLELSPGDSTGRIVVQGAFSQSTDGVVNIEIAGGDGVPGVDYDRLDVRTNARLAGGILQATLINGFTPSAGDLFPVLVAAEAVIGTFDEYLLPDLGNDLNWRVLYQPSDVTLAVLWSGDFDQDGAVDGDDFLIWQGNFGLQEGATMDDGDADGDGDVDGEDFLNWQSQFGNTGGSAATATGRQIPEPTSLVLLTLALFGVWFGLCTKRQRCRLKDCLTAPH